MFNFLKIKKILYRYSLCQLFMVQVYFDYFSIEKKKFSKKPKSIILKS